MKDLLIELRRNVKAIHSEKMLGLVGPEQAKAKLQALAADTKAAKAKAWEARGKQLAEIKAGIIKKSKATMHALDPVTDADYIRATYKDAQAARTLSLMDPAELRDELRKIRDNPENFDISHGYVEQVQVEAMRRGVAPTPGQPSAPMDFPAIVRELRGVLAAKHFDSPWELAPEWKALQEQEALHANAAAPGRIQIMHEGQAAIYDIDREVEYEPSRAELEGKADRKWSQMDKLAGLTPDPEKPLVFAMGDSDAEVKQKLVEEQAKYSGIDTF